ARDVRAQLEVEPLLHRELGTLGFALEVVGEKIARLLWRDRRFAVVRGEVVKDAPFSGEGAEVEVALLARGPGREGGGDDSMGGVGGRGGAGRTVEGGLAVGEGDVEPRLSVVGEDDADRIRGARAAVLLDDGVVGARARGAEEAREAFEARVDAARQLL